MAMAVPLLSWVHRNVCQDLLEDTCEGKPFLFKWGARYTSKFHLLFDVKFKEEGRGEGRERREGGVGEENLGGFSSFYPGKSLLWK